MKRALAVLFLLATAITVAWATTPTEYQVEPFGTTAYRIDGVNNPTLTLIRGRTYVFHVNAIGHPFYIKTNFSTGTGNQYTNGVTNNGADQDDVTFVVPMNAPNQLFYNCSVHNTMRGTLDIQNRGVPGIMPIGAGALALLVIGFGAWRLRRRVTA